MNDNVVEPHRPTDDPAKQPIGYWLNRCDRAITKAMDSRLDEYGTNRTDWQVLNVVARNGTVATAHLYDFLQANADRKTLAASTETLLSRGHLRWTESDSDELQLTEQGNAFRQQLSEQIAALRNELMRGIMEEEYIITLSVLQRIAQNLEGR